MANKDSYWRKHKEKIHGAETEDKIRNIPVELSDEVKNEFSEGKLLLIDKPLHWTSFDVVRKIRNSIHIKKVGHAGTLDPLATGLLIVCTGKFTKKINEYMAQEKEYTGTITFGAVTPTYDLESLPEKHTDISGLTNKKILHAVKSFIGEVQQLPPIYSAIKRKGIPLYELARRGEEVELQPRNIFIKEFEITHVELPCAGFRIVCSTGTYIRSIAHDLGAMLGCGGYLSELRRTRIGEFSVSESTGIEKFIEGLRNEAGS